MPKYRASIENHAGVHEIQLQSGSQVKTLQIAPKSDGFASSVSGGELLFLALATCYCNDIYREGARRGIKVERVEVEVSGEFEGEHIPTRAIRYSARVKADAEPAAILDLMRYTDEIAEIHNSIRTGPSVTLEHCEVI